MGELQEGAEEEMSVHPQGLYTGTLMILSTNSSSAEVNLAFLIPLKIWRGRDKEQEKWRGRKGEKGRGQWGKGRNRGGREKER